MSNEKADLAPSRRFRRVVLAVVVSVVVTLAAISRAPADDTAPGSLSASVTLGPVIGLADWTFVDVSTTHDGRVHLIGGKYAPPGRFMYLAHLTVDRDGSQSEDPIASVPLVRYGLSAEFEASGVLHVAADNDHYRRLEAGWDGPTKGPACEQMVLAADKLLCANRISSKDVGGNFNAAKLLLFQQVGAGWAPWRVVDRDDPTILGGFDLVADGARGVHLLYAALDKVRGGITNARAVGQTRVRYLRLTLESLAPQLQEFRPTSGSVKVPPLAGDEGVSRTEITVPSEGVALAVNPESGRVLAASTYHQASKEKYPLVYAIRDGVADSPGPIGDFAGEPSAVVRLASAGSNRFHAVIGYTSGKPALGHLVYYLRAGNDWSRPIDLADASSDIVSISTSLQIAVDKGDAFVTWVDDKDKKARGRWVHVAP